jgi:hypothetical protein
VLLFVIVIDAAIPVWPTVTATGKVGLVDKPAPASTGTAGMNATPITAASTATTTVQRNRMKGRIVI